MSEAAVAQVRCDWHQWISTHQPDFPVYWIRQCSVCGYYDPVDMAEQIARHATTPEQASLKAERDAALATIERVRALHTSKDNDRDVEWCAHDMHGWPCPTIRALEPLS